jgi:DNA-binding CsgD family transcriptional regulator
MEVARQQGAVTRWAGATASGASIPLGALAHLVPPLRPGSEPNRLQLLHQATAALVAAGDGGRVVLVVDDAHLLDDTSATLVHQLALNAAVSLVVTVRTGEAAPDPVVALWKDGLIDRLELQPLSRLEIEEAMGAVLGGTLDSLTLERLCLLTQGNPLFLREVVNGERDTERLVETGGVWRWQGAFTPTPRLAELIASRLSRLETDEHRLVRLLAFGEPLGASIAAQLVSATALRSAERSGLVAVEKDGRRRSACLSHPIYGEVIRAQSSVLEACELRGALARAMASRVRRRGDVLRHATLQLNASGTADPDLLVVAARHAMAARDHGLAERLARAALAAGDGFDAQLALGAALNCQGRMRDAEAVLSGAPSMASTDHERAMVALTWAPNLFWGQGRADEAEAMLQRTQDAIGDAVVIQSLIGLRSTFSLFAGRPRESIALSAAVLKSELAADDVLVWAGLSLSYGLARCGRTSEGLTAGARARDGLNRCSETSIMLWPAVYQCEVTSLWLAGRLEQAQTRAVSYEDHCRLHAWEGVDLGVARLLQGQIALALGHPATAIRLLHQAIDRVTEAPRCWQYWCLLTLTEALAVSGDANGAADALAQLQTPAFPSEIFRLWAPDTLLAAAWVAAAAGEVSRAASLATEAAEAAAAGGQSTIEALALHASLRLGHLKAVPDRLRELAGEVDGVLVSTCSAHADALAAGDGAGLDRVAARFQAMGACILAAEAANQAAGAHLRAGRRGASWGSMSRARQFADACEGARTPALEEAHPLPLTRREQEVARLAAQGLTNRAIAERLVVSVRTVEGHLEQAYGKLNISSRAELTVALCGASR